MNVPFHKRASALVSKFVTTLNIPEECRILDRGDARDVNLMTGRRFTVQIALVVDGREAEAYRLLSLLVSQNEEVHIVSDRRPYITNLLSRPQVSICRREYDEDEARKLFQEYITATPAMMPDWVSSIEAATGDDVRRGFDAWVHLDNLHGHRHRAPVKVCVSRAHKRKYFSRRTPKEINKTLAVIVTPAKGRIETMRDFFSLLQNIRNSGMY